MSESGQISRLWSRWKADAKEDCFDQGAAGLGLTNLFTAWLILSGLAFLAGIIGIVEYYVFKKIGAKEKLPKKEEDSLKDSWNSGSSLRIEKILLAFWRTSKLPSHIKRAAL